MATLEDMAALIRKAQGSKRATLRLGKIDSREARNPKDDKRSNNDRREKTDRRKGKADWTDEERRTRGGRRSMIGRRVAAK
ncbi:MAG: hypothetical protein IIC56_05780 [Proteobacteria bacterium]|nr:hypothetical protein [Pseudomonadota bacterium]